MMTLMDSILGAAEESCVRWHPQMSIHRMPSIHRRRLEAFSRRTGDLESKGGNEGVGEVVLVRPWPFTQGRVWRAWEWQNDTIDRFTYKPWQREPSRSTKVVFDRW